MFFPMAGTAVKFLHYSIILEPITLYTRLINVDLLLVETD
jgi:hypothetical protein